MFRDTAELDLSFVNLGLSNLFISISHQSNYVALPAVLCKLTGNTWNQDVVLQMTNMTLLHMDVYEFCWSMGGSSTWSRLHISIVAYRDLWSVVVPADDRKLTSYINTWTLPFLPCSKRFIFVNTQYFSYINYFVG